MSLHCLSILLSPAIMGRAMPAVIIELLQKFLEKRKMKFSCLYLPVQNSLPAR